MSAEMMQGIFLPIFGFETTLVYNACAVTKLPWVLEKIRLFVRNPAGSHQYKSRCTEKKEKMTEIQPHE